MPVAKNQERVEARLLAKIKKFPGKGNFRCYATPSEIVLLHKMGAVVTHSMHQKQIDRAVIRKKNGDCRPEYFYFSARRELQRRIEESLGKRENGRRKKTSKSES